jgi:hypothetical protein
MDESGYTWKDRAFARLLGLPDDPDALELGRNLRFINVSLDDVSRARVKRSVAEAMGDLNDRHLPKAA